MVGALALRRRRLPGQIAWRVLTAGVALAAAGEVIDFICIAARRRPLVGGARRVKSRTLRLQTGSLAVTTPPESSRYRASNV